MSNGGQELRMVQEAYSALATLNDDGRRRALAWLTDVFLEGGHLVPSRAEFAPGEHPNGWGMGYSRCPVFTPDGRMSCLLIRNHRGACAGVEPNGQQVRRWWSAQGTRVTGPADPPPQGAWTDGAEGSGPRS